VTTSPAALVPSVSVVVPVFNGKETIEELVSRCVAQAERSRIALEVILVNDGSRDGSWEAIRRLSAGPYGVRGIDLARNFGQHNAVLCGIRAARAPVIVTLDDDLQHPPEEIPKLLARIDEGYDCVYGRPRQERHGLWRRLASRITKLVLQRAMGAETAGEISAFRAFRVDLRDAFADVREPLVNIDVLLTWGGGRFTSVDVRHDPRRVGQSNYSASKLIVHALNMLTGFSSIPLRVATALGFALATLGGVLLAVVLGVYLWRGPAVPGFAFLASVVCLFSGAQLFSVGIMGEYLARTHFRTMGKPPYLVRNRTEP